jgi:DNA-binding protein HU-beta
LNKEELVNAVLEKTLTGKKESEKAVTAVMESISEALAKGDKVQLVGFGTFEVRSRKEREGRNPKTGEKIIIKATKVPAFKAGKALKDMVK